MRIYFLSSRPCALKVGGVYFGRVDDFERFADVTLSDRLFLEFIPENGLPLCFFLTEDIRFTPPKGCEVYLLRDAIALYARDFPPSDFSLRVIAQKREENCLATLAQQGDICLTLQTEENYFTATLPPSFCKSELFFACGLLFIKGQNQLAIFTQKGERVFLENVLSYEVENTILRVRIPLCECLGRVADCEYDLDGEGIRRTKYTLSQTACERTQELLPLAFFESLLIGANYEELLADELISEKEKIASFLGDFVAVSPTDEENRFVLLRKKQENLFEGTYYTVLVEKNKIADITT